MKLLGATDDMNGGRGPSSHRSQDDAAVGYVFQRHPHESADFPHFSHKQPPQPPRWASGDETIIDVSIHLLSILLYGFCVVFGFCCAFQWSLLFNHLVFNWASICSTFLVAVVDSFFCLSVNSSLRIDDVVYCDCIMDWCWRIIFSASLDYRQNSSQIKLFPVGNVFDLTRIHCVDELTLSHSFFQYISVTAFNLVQVFSLNYSHTAGSSLCFLPLFHLLVVYFGAVDTDSYQNQNVLKSAMLLPSFSFFCSASNSMCTYSSVYIQFAPRALGFYFSSQTHHNVWATQKFIHIGFIFGEYEGTMWFVSAARFVVAISCAICSGKSW